ncbi:MAG: NAD(P)H-binding protein [Acidimicrobiia bacterium]
MTTGNRNHNGSVLVLGGTGKTGRRVAERLAARGVPVRIGSRSGRPAFDWNDESTWSAALEGVQAAYLVYYPDLAMPGAAETVGALAAQARAHGVEHLVLLSGRGEEGARRGEQAVQQAGTAWTIVRSSWFSQNFSEDYLLAPVLSGEIVLPAGDVAEPFVDADDIADVAVAALTERRHAGQVYEMTGPRLLTFGDAADEIGKACGRDVRYVPVTPDEFAARAREQDTVPVELVGPLTDLFAEVLDGRNASLTDGVERALGRAPRDFTDYARATARTGVWAR